MNNYPGKLIVLYGINNLGKSTQAKLLVTRLKANGYQAEYLKYPIYELNPSGQILNDYLRLGNTLQLTPREVQIIYALNRDQYQEEIIKKLKSGVNLIAEDYKGTGIAWGLGAGVEEKFLKQINSHLLDEDLVFLFDGERFREAIENGHRHENNEDLINKVRWAHLKLREEYGWLKINANLTIEEIHEQLWKRVCQFLKKPEVAPDFKAIESLLVEKIKPQAKLLQKAHREDAGYDLYSDDYYSIPPYGQALVSTGLKLSIPTGLVGLIWDKSSLALEGIKTMGGVIDSNYRGEIKVIVKNLSEGIFNLLPGQKIAQILFQPIRNLEISEKKINNNTERAENSFGSSGKF
jgi:dUTP pyrophosphatase